jgi:hypothetical protein
MSGHFLTEYLQTITGCDAVPPDRNSIEILLETYIMEASCSAIIKNAAGNQGAIAGSIVLLKSILTRNG